MIAHTTGRRTGKLYYYYRCPTRMTHGRNACPNGKQYPARKQEERVWGFVADLLTEPEQVLPALDRLVEDERSRLSGNPEQEEKTWLRTLEALDRKRENAQSEAVAQLLNDGLLDPDNLRATLLEMDEQRKTAQCELEACRNRGQRVRNLEERRDWHRRSYAFEGEPWDALKEWAEAEGAPLARWHQEIRQEQRDAMKETLQTTPSEERCRMYRRLGLRVETRPNGELKASGIFAQEADSIPAPGADSDFVDGVPC